MAGSEGDWLDQSMDDRAREVTAAIAWAKSRPDIDTSRIGLWGTSQGGWVMPKVAADAPEDVRFVIAVAPAINWVEQGRYNTLAELRAEGASPGEIRAEHERGEVRLRLLREGASYEEYRQAVGDAQGITAARWRFISKNYTADASRDLPAMRTKNVLLILGGQDLNVDVADTEATYRRILTGPGELRVRRYPDATHALLKKRIEDSRIKLTLTAVFAPRALFTDGYLTDQRRYLEQFKE